MSSSNPTMSFVPRRKAGARSVPNGPRIAARMSALLHLALRQLQMHHALPLHGVDLLHALEDRGDRLGIVALLLGVDDRRLTPPAPVPGTPGSWRRCFNRGGGSSSPLRASRTPYASKLSRAAGARASARAPRRRKSDRRCGPGERVAHHAVPGAHHFDPLWDHFVQRRIAFALRIEGSPPLVPAARLLRGIGIARARPYSVAYRCAGASK